MARWRKQGGKHVLTVACASDGDLKSTLFYRTIQFTHATATILILSEGKECLLMNLCRVDSSSALSRKDAQESPKNLLTTRRKFNKASWHELFKDDSNVLFWIDWAAA